MKKLFVCALSALALVGLASCGEEEKPQVTPETPQENPADEFDQNKDEIKPDIHVYIVGSHWNDWKPDYELISKAEPSLEFVLDETSSGLNTKYTYTATVTQEMVDKWCGFKFVGTTGWGTQWGMEDVDFTKSNKDFLEKVVGDKNGDTKFDVNDKYEFKEGTSNRNNIVATVPGTYVIEYYPYNFVSETKNDVPYSCKFAVQYTAA